MAMMKEPLATDSAEELRGVIGDDASATFESDPNFVESNPTGSASSEHVLRDADDTEDSDEEEEEDVDGEDIDEDEEDDEDDEDDEDLDDEEEDDADEVLRAAEPVDVHGPGKHSRADIEAELEEMEEEEGETEAVDPLEDAVKKKEDLHADLAIDEALRMSAMAIANEGY